MTGDEGTGAITGVTVVTGGDVVTGGALLVIVALTARGGKGSVVK